MDNQKEMNQFCDMLPPSLKSLVMQHIFINAFKLNPIFTDCENLIDAVIKDIIPFLLKPDDIIVEQGEEGHHFYFIAEGQCCVSYKDHKEVTHQKPTTLNQGDFFGEIAILFNCKRSATVKSTNYCTSARIHSSVLMKSCKKFIGMIKNRTIHYDDKFKLFKIKILKQIDYFEVNDHDMSQLMLYEELQNQMLEDNYETA